MKIKNLLKFTALTYAIICIIMYSQQRSLMYRPAGALNPPESFGLENFTKTMIETNDSVHVETWYTPAKNNYPTIIYFHGNMGNLSYRVNFFRLLSEHGFGVLGLDYRGYGNSEGSPSEEGFYNDGRAAVEQALITLAVPENKIIIYGESIGTGVAVQMATEYKTAGLILQSPFTSMLDTVSFHYPWLPVSLLLSDRFDSKSKIANIHTPLVILHGEIDTIIPISQGKELFAAAAEPKKPIYFSNTGHNNFNQQELIKILLEFSKTYKIIE